jgi:hypothetical protein
VRHLLAKLGFFLSLLAALPLFGNSSQARAECIGIDSLDRLDLTRPFIDGFSHSDPFTEVDQSSPSFQVTNEADSPDAPRDVAVLGQIRRLLASFDPLSCTTSGSDGGSGAGFPTGPNGANAGLFSRLEVPRPQQISILVIENVSLPFPPIICGLLDPPRSAS